MSDYIKHLDTLRTLLPRLRAGEIYAIEFGDPDMPKGPMSHHRIRLIATPAGSQFCFKLISRRMEGSGEYIGMPDDREIEIRAQSKLESYLALERRVFEPQKFSAHSLPSSKLMYFAVDKD